MPRSPSDATRFTATRPHISAQPASSTSFASNPPNVAPAASSSSHFEPSTPGQPGETPQQKIARLRAAAAVARRGKESQFDSVVRVGRKWADRAHRFTAIGLIGLTVVSAAVATAGITDMLLHNRKRKQEWLAEQQRKTAVDLEEAKRARGAGIATEDQMLLINRERAAQEAADAKKNRPGMFKRAKSWLFSGLSEEEQKGGRLGAGAAIASATTSATGVAPHTGGEAMLGETEDRGVLQAVQKGVDSHRRTGEQPEGILRPTGGPLDRQAQSAIDVAADAGRGWMSWVTGR